nr:tetratricopeptide repeat protein [uncultured Chryseobacterium sp.]
MKNILSLVLALFLSVRLYACLNGETLKLANGIILYEDYEGYVPYGHSFRDKESLNKILVSLKDGYDETQDLDYLSDQGFVLIILGKYGEAIDLYKKIESIVPGRYSTASNIGTAYELIGSNQEALKWIEKAVKINHNSHFHSEWIHINILKAKIYGERYITSQFLIGKDFGTDKFPKSDLTKKQLDALRDQLYYQLNERISFVKQKDKIVAQLLFDLANVSYLADDKDEAMENYKLAENYGFKDEILSERMNLTSSETIFNIERKVIKEFKYQTKPVRRTHLIETTVSIFALLFSGLMVFIFRKRIFLLLK